jgi:serine/threonine protein kinase
VRGLEAERVHAKVRSRLFRAPEVAVKVDRYVLDARVGEGAMGAVYRARDPELQRDVALKLLRDAPPGDKVLEEARAMAKLEHPNLLGIHDVGTHEGHVFLVMKYVDGANLARWLDAAPRSVREVVRVFTAAARGLSAAHRASVVHRDFKPENVLLDLSGNVVVADFGLARGASAGLVPGAPAVQTQAAGTPAFMAPELLDGGPATALSDQYAFFVALYQALAGALPFPATSVIALRGAQAHGPAKSSRVPAWLDRVIRRGLSVEPTARFASMDEVIAVLDRGAPRTGMALAAVAIVLAAGAGTAAWLRPQPVPITPAPVPVRAPQPEPQVAEPQPNEPQPPAPEPAAPQPPPKKTPAPGPKPKPGVAANFNAVWDDAWKGIKTSGYQQCTKKTFDATVHWNGNGEVREVKLTNFIKVLTDEERACLDKVLRKIRIPPFDHDAWPPVDDIPARLNE